MYTNKLRLYSKHILFRRKVGCYPILSFKISSYNTELVIQNKQKWSIGAELEGKSLKIFSYCQ